MRPHRTCCPHDLESAARKLAIDHEAEIEVTTGEALLRAGYRTIHTVGRASASPPRLIDLRWGDPARPKVTLVGKGVCFDSGGLNLKPASNMRLMKKDMGGAAHALGLAKLVMSRALSVRLRVLVPAVENAVSANAYRPGDVIRTYQGLTVEIDNTDAEGRLVLADALALAAEEHPGRDRRLRHLDRCGPQCARHRATGHVRQRRRSGRGNPSRGWPRRRRRVADALVRPLSADAGQQGRRPGQQSGIALRRRHHGRTLPRTLRRRHARGSTSTSWPGTLPAVPHGQRAARRWDCARSTTTWPSVGAYNRARDGAQPR